MNPYYKITTMEQGREEEVSNRVENVAEFVKPLLENGTSYMVEKLSEAEYNETEQ